MKRRPRRATALIYAARVADIWLHPIAFLRGRRRHPMTFDDLRQLGLLETHTVTLAVDGVLTDAEVTV